MTKGDTVNAEQASEAKFRNSNIRSPRHVMRHREIRKQRPLAKSLTPLPSSASNKQTRLVSQYIGLHTVHRPPPTFRSYLFSYPSHETSHLNFWRTSTSTQ